MSTLAATTRIGDSRVVGVVENGRVLEIWHIRCDNISEKRVDLDLPKEKRSRTVDGQHQQCDVARQQVTRQKWGHFIIRMYRVQRFKAGALILGLLTLIPGILIAVISCIRFVQVPVAGLVAAVVMIAVGALSIMASGLWADTRVTGGVPLASLGVSTEALGFTSEAIAIEAIPAGYKRGDFKGEMEFEAAVGEPEVLEEYSTGSGWYHAS